MLGAEGRVMPALARLLRMARPVDVETGKYHVGTVRLVHDVGHSRCGLRVWSEQTNERLTTVPIFASRKPTIPIPDHMEWMGYFSRPHSGCQYAHPLDLSRSRFCPMASTCTSASGPRHPEYALRSESPDYIPIITSLLGSLP